MRGKLRSVWLAMIVALALANPGRCDEPAAFVAVSAEAVAVLNAQPVIGRPSDAEAPSKFSVDHAAHTGAYNFQAPGIAVAALPDGRTRVWVSWYQQNNNPGGGAIGNGSTPHCVYAYSDDPFTKADPVWHPAVYVDPVTEQGDETASDPEVFMLVDGRLLCSYITSGPGKTRKRSTYAFLIGNPLANSGAFELGQQHWLDYGVLSQPFVVAGTVYAVIDEWNVARRFCKLTFPTGSERDASIRHDTIVRQRISDIPWPGHPELTIFFEGSVHAVSDDRFRAYRRTKQGVYTSLSDVGGTNWGSEVKWTDHGSVDSRSAFARSPFSGRVIGAVNDAPSGERYRTDLTLVVSEAEGAPGSFKQALNIEPDGGTRKVASQYPRLAFDAAGYVYCVYRWSDRRSDAPHHGAAIRVARVREEWLAAGKATLADVEKRVTVIATPAKRNTDGN